MTEVVPADSAPVNDWHEGQELPAQVYQVTRADLVRYAGASGDFNPIHWSDRIARSVGLPGVIAHGMYTMALAGRALAVWAGRPDAVIEFGVRFTKPVVVPDDDTGAEVVVAGVVRTVTPAVPGEGLTAAAPDRAQIDLTVTSGGEKVLAQARATLRLRAAGQ
ncbi:MAG TPA: MaoC/PaaZ C-terminal domain-containing protein [Jiangellales bacterium]|nr:MaoC/PaaZ C-terminal domain-containing protein [Jiangellales bacterium]